MILNQYLPLLAWLVMPRTFARVTIGDANSGLGFPECVSPCIHRSKCSNPVYQPFAFTLHDRTKIRPFTITNQMPIREFLCVCFTQDIGQSRAKGGVASSAATRSR
jgi:hypothetical protein